MDDRKALDGLAVGIMVLLCPIWGLQQVVLKIAAPDISPLMQIALRSGLSAVLLVLFMRWRGEPVSLLDADWRPGMMVGGLFAVEFLLVGEGMRFTSASHMVVLLYTAPIFVALALHWKLPSERLGALQWAGIALAFAGIAVAFLGRPHPTSDAGMTRILFGDLLGLLSGAAWGATTVAVRLSGLAKAPAAKTLLYQLVWGFVLLMLAAAALGQLSIHVTPLAVGSMAFHAIIVSFASYLLWFWLLRKYLASRLGVFSFLTPLFGVLFGVWLLDERLEPGFIAGTALVFAGVALVTGHGWLKRLMATNEARRNAP